MSERLPSAGGVPAIRFRGVTKRYRLSRLHVFGLKHALLHLPQYVRGALRSEEFTALSDVTFDVRAGESLGVIGRNGSGKSTTLGLIAGVLRPTTGEVAAHGRICPLLELGAGFHYDLTGRENITLNGVLLGLTRAEVARRADAIIEFSGLAEFIDRPLRVYSSGMIARLGFSVAVHLEPDILLVDEVLAVGDADFQAKCMARMEEFRRRGVTIVFVSHNLEAVKRICSRVVLLDAGRVVFDGSAADAIAAYAGLAARPAPQSR